MKKTIVIAASILILFVSITLCTQKSEDGYFWNVSDVLLENPRVDDEPVKWTNLVQSENATVNIVQVEKLVKSHFHEDQDEIVYVVSGEGNFTVGDEERWLKPGDIIFIPKGTVHGGEFELPAVAVSVYTPSFDMSNPDRVFVENEKI